MNLQNAIDFLQNQNIDLFDGVTVPDPLDAELTKSAIVMRCGLLTPMIGEPLLLRSYITHWFLQQQWNFKHLLSIVQAEYSPIENVSETTQETRNTTGSRNKTNAFTTGRNETENGSHSVTKDGSESGTTSNTSSGSESGNDTEEEKVSAYNTGSYSPDRQTETENTRTTSGTDNGTSSKETEENESGNTSNTKTMSGNDSSTENETNTGEDVFTRSRHGNIGTVTNTKLIMEELELIGKFNPYRWIAEQFENDIMLAIY